MAGAQREVGRFAWPPVVWGHGLAIGGILTWPWARPTVGLQDGLRGWPALLTLSSFVPGALRRGTCASLSCAARRCHPPCAGRWATTSQRGAAGTPHRPRRTCAVRALLSCSAAPRARAAGLVVIGRGPGEAVLALHRGQAFPHSWQV
jgi:hypothetical protein